MIHKRLDWRGVISAAWRVDRNAVVAHKITHINISDRINGYSLGVIETCVRDADGCDRSLIGNFAIELNGVIYSYISGQKRTAEFIDDVHLSLQINSNTAGPK